MILLLKQVFFLIVIFNMECVKTGAKYVVTRSLLDDNFFSYFCTLLIENKDYINMNRTSKSYRYAT